MNFPQFWARGQSDDFLVWRWSSQSLAEAQALANQAAQELAARFRAGNRWPSHGGYYPDRPFREQVLQEIKNGYAEATAVVTRNSYGCLVLNTARVMFVDIDLPEPPRKRKGFFQSLFGKPEPEPPPGANPAEQLAVERVENWSRGNRDWGWRIYRTRAGLRLLATQGPVGADSSTANSVFEAFDADPLYRKLCQSQKCYRARLTPKPWRCGVFSKPQRWPWLNAKEEIKFQKWEAHYKTASAEWATCELIRTIGNSIIHPEAQSILKLHDDVTRAESKLPLA